jgi:hypothetical protein
MRKFGKALKNFFTKNWDIKLLALALAAITVIMVNL